MHFSKDINEKHQFQLNYSRRINRPQPWLLNSTPSYIDANNVFMGNPYIKFEFTDALEFNYRTGIKKINVSTQTYLRNTTNPFTSARYIDKEGKFSHQLTNAKRQVAFGVEQNIDSKITKWLQLNGNINLYHYILETQIMSTDETREVNTWDARITSSCNFKTKTQVQATGTYRAANYDAMGRNSGFFNFNLGVNQSFLQGRLRAGLSCQNLFNTIKFDYSVKTEDFQNIYDIRFEGPTFTASLTYNLNNFQNINRGRADDTSFKSGGGL